MNEKKIGMITAFLITTLLILNLGGGLFTKLGKADEQIRNAGRHLEVFPEIVDMDNDGEYNDTFIYVLLIENNSKIPAKGAVVNVTGLGDGAQYNNTADRNGTCVFRNLPKGDYHANATYFDVELNKTFTAGTKFHIKSEPPEQHWEGLDVRWEIGDLNNDSVFFDLAFRVKNTSGYPLLGAVIQIKDHENRFHDEGKTDRYGTFIFKNLPEGFYNTEIVYRKADGHSLYFHETFYVGWGGWIEGLVFDNATEKPLPNTRIEIEEVEEAEEEEEEAEEEEEEAEEEEEEAEEEEEEAEEEEEEAEEEEHWWVDDVHTDREGRFNVTLGPGRYLLKVQKDEYFMKRTPLIKVMVNKTMKIELGLEKGNSWITGRLITEGGSKAYHNISVNIWKTGAGWSPSHMGVGINETGGFRFTVRPGIYDLRVFSWDQRYYRITKKGIEVFKGKDTYLEFKLENGTSGIRGAVKDDRGNPVNEASIVVYKVGHEQGGWEPSYPVNDVSTWGKKNGTYRLVLRPGLYDIYCWSENYEGWEKKDVLVKSGSFLPLPIELKPRPRRDSWIVGKVIDGATDEPIKGALIPIVPAGTGFGEDQEDYGAMTNDAGEYKVDVPAGKYDLHGIAPGYVMSNVFGVETKHNGTTVVNITIRKGTSWISGHVYDATTEPEKPVEEAFVFAWKNGTILGGDEEKGRDIPWPDGFALTEFSNDGYYNISVPAGKYDVMAGPDDEKYRHLVEQFKFMVPVRAGMETTLDFHLEEDYGIRVWARAVDMDGDGVFDDIMIGVEDENGEPLEGAVVYLKTTSVGKTDAKGLLLVEDVKPGKYDIHAVFEGAIGGTEIVIGEEGDILEVVARVFDDDGDGIDDDVKIAVVNAEGEPIRKAEVNIDGESYGFTDEEGVLLAYDFRDGVHKVDIIKWFEDRDILLYGHTEFKIGSKFMYAEAFVFSADDDEVKNDVNIYVYDPERMPVPKAEIVIDEESYGFTDRNGSLEVYDMDDGVHRVRVEKWVPRHEIILVAKTEFKIGEKFMYVDAYIFAKDGERKDDVRVFVYKADGEPMTGAEVYIDEEFFGKTDRNGSLIVPDFDDGLHFVKVKKWVPAYGIILIAKTEFKIGQRFMYVDAYVHAAQDDGLKNDVRIHVHNHEGAPIRKAEVYVDDEFFGVTDANGTLALEDLKDGVHLVYVSKMMEQFGMILYAKTRFKIGERYMFAEAYVFAKDADDVKNDATIYVYLADGKPVKGAEVYVDDRFVGMTDSNGSAEGSDFRDGRHKVDIFKKVERFGIILHASTGFKIGQKFMHADALVLDADSDNVKDDVIIYVYDFKGNALKGAEVYIDDEWYGVTNIQGSLTAMDFSEGNHIVDLFVYLERENEKGNFTVDLHARTQFYIGDEGFVWVEAFVLASDDDDYVNDVKVKAYFGEDEPQPDAKVYVDEYGVGRTDADGTLLVKDTSAGWHEVTISYEGMFATKRFYSYGKGEQYIYLEHYVKAILPSPDENGKKDDVVLYVYDSDDVAVASAKVFIDGEFWGMTSKQGYLTAFDLPKGYHFVDVYYSSEEGGNDTAYAWTEVFIGKDFHYGDAYMNDEDGDGYPDDAEIWAYDDDGKPVPKDEYNVSVDGEEVEGNNTTRGAEDKLTLENLPAGLHFVTITVGGGTRAGESFEFTFVSKGSSDAHEFIYAKPLTLDADEDGDKDDVRIYIYGSDMSPLAGADVYIDGEKEGTTGADGYLDVTDISGADLKTGAHTGYAEFGDLKCGIGMSLDEIEPPKPQLPDIGEVKETIEGFSVEIRHRIKGNLELKSADKPGDAPKGKVSLGIYLDVTATSALGDGEWVYIPLEYDEEDLPDGVDEETLAMYYWDEGEGEWVKCESTDVNTEDNIVWANVSHLTIFAPMALESGEGGEGEGEGGGGTSWIVFAVIAVIIALFIIIALVVRSKKETVEVPPEAEEEEDLGEEAWEEEEEDFGEDAWIEEEDLDDLPGEEPEEAEKEDEPVDDNDFAGSDEDEFIDEEDPEGDFGFDEDEDFGEDEDIDFLTD